MKVFNETLYDALGQSFRIDKVYFENKTEHQHLMIFHNARLGRAMTLDGVVQTTEADEFIYHEMMAHVPLFAHGQARHVLIIGGGDGAMLRSASQQQTDKVVLASTHRDHIAPSSGVAQPALLYRNPLHPSLDGNSVDAHVEQAKFAENAMLFQTSFTFLNSKVNGLMKALKGE